MRRRDFTLLGLATVALAAARPAWAEDVPAPDLRAKITAHRSGTTLFVSLAVENRGPDAAELHVLTGSRPAPKLVVYVMEGEASFELTPMAWLDDQRRTRAGPRPVYRPLAADDSMNIGTYRFTVPMRYAEAALPVEIRVTARAGIETVELPATELSVEA